MEELKLMEGKLTCLNLLRKLMEIQEGVMALKKNAKTFSYEYLKGEKLLDYIRPAMDARKLMLMPEVIQIESKRIDYKTKSGEKSEMLYIETLFYTWVDTETGETLTLRWAGTGANDWDKGHGSALTYGERYFLLKYFHISTDEDDVDYLQGEKEKKEAAAAKAVNRVPVAATKAPVAPPKPTPAAPVKSEQERKEGAVKYLKDKGVVLDIDPTTKKYVCEHTKQPKIEDATTLENIKKALTLLGTPLIGAGENEKHIFA